MDTPFAGATVIVAGGTGGLGAAVSLAFAAGGARVVVTYRRDAELATLRQRAAAGAAPIEGHAVDVTDAASVHAMVAATLDRHARIDALVNTVGGYAGGWSWTGYPGNTLWDWLSLVLGPVVIATLVIPAAVRWLSGDVERAASEAERL